MRDWVINFAEVSDGQITIKNNSTACVIEIISDHPENLKPTSLFLEYHEFDSLINCINRLAYLNSTEEIVKREIDKVFDKFDKK
jgi:hypothetical protein